MAGKRLETGNGVPKVAEAKWWSSIERVEKALEELTGVHGVSRLIMRLKGELLDLARHLARLILIAETMTDPRQRTKKLELLEEEIQQIKTKYFYLSQSFNQSS